MKESFGDDCDVLFVVSRTQYSRILTTVKGTEGAAQQFLATEAHTMTGIKNMQCMIQDAWSLALDQFYNERGGRFGKKSSKCVMAACRFAQSHVFLYSRWKKSRTSMEGGEHAVDDGAVHALFHALAPYQQPGAQPAMYHQGYAAGAIADGALPRLTLCFAAVDQYGQPVPAGYADLCGACPTDGCVQACVRAADDAAGAVPAAAHADAAAATAAGPGGPAPGPAPPVAAARRHFALDLWPLDSDGGLVRTWMQQHSVMKSRICGVRSTSPCCGDACTCVVVQPNQRCLHGDASSTPASTVSPPAASRTATRVHFLAMPASPPLVLLVPTLVLGTVAELFGQREIRVVHRGSTLRALVNIVIYSGVEVGRRRLKFTRFQCDCILKILLNDIRAHPRQAVLVLALCQLLLPDDVTQGQVRGAIITHTCNNCQGPLTPFTRLLDSAAITVYALINVPYWHETACRRHAHPLQAVDDVSHVRPAGRSLYCAVVSAGRHADWAHQVRGCLLAPSAQPRSVLIGLEETSDMPPLAAVLGLVGCVLCVIQLHSAFGTETLLRQAHVPRRFDAMPAGCASACCSGPLPARCSMPWCHSRTALRWRICRRVRALCGRGRVTRAAEREKADVGNAMKSVPAAPAVGLQAGRALACLGVISSSSCAMVTIVYLKQRMGILPPPEPITTAILRQASTTLATWQLT